MPNTLLIAYAGDCLLQARMEVPEGRLSDFLNSTGSLVLRDAVMQAHEDGRVVRIDRLIIDRDDIFAIEASGTRGHRQRRIRTLQSRMEFVLGPYRVLGQLHAPPGADPLAALARRKPIVPVTASTIGYHVGAETRLHDVETLLVNRELVDRVRPQVLDIAFKNMPELAVSRDSGVEAGPAWHFTD
jgi:hypothetical protein